ncbi:amino acid permease [Neisseria sp. Ec49-e6-T10]|uniref:amino acid permease n=1 Tax=Neisseria sp. Ec49-e6-T10 TaxID=3140744 RepID=UPI003EBAB4E1
MTENQQNSSKLKRGLSNRHIQLIALGGAIGTGLFLGVASSVIQAGPSVILGYAIAGIIAFFIMRQLGEMVVEEPVAGSFSHFAHKYWGNFAGFSSGWNYWILYILVSMAELTAIGKYIQFWFPDIPLWVSSALFFILINAINLTNVKFYGEAEFWFAIIKVIAIIGMIIFGGYLLFSGNAGPQATINNLWNDGGFFPHGGTGLMMAMAVIMFSFGGLELIGITAAEAEDPQKSIPKATNQVIYRILIFYIGALVILFSLYPWREVTSDSSPFVMVFASLNGLEFSLFGQVFHFTNIVAHILNVVVLTAALSVYNSCVYCNSRMLYGLAKQGNAPRILGRLNSHGVPVIATLMSASIAAICVLVAYVAPHEALEYLMSLVVSALIINWCMISLTHLKFRKIKNTENVHLKFKSIAYPFTNYLCLFFLTGILVIMWFNKMYISVLLIPVWLLILFIGFKMYKKQAE